MQKLEWSPELSVGIDAIDAQHRTWISHFNAVLEAVESNKDQETVISTLDFLSSYTEKHFSTEEKYMKENAYPAYAAHLAKHNDLKATVADLVRDFREDGVSRQLADAINTLLCNWLVGHIREMDMAFAKFAQDNAIEIHDPA